MDVTNVERRAAPPAWSRPAPGGDGFTSRPLATVAAVGALVAAGPLFVLASDLFFLVCLSAVLAVLLRAFSEGLARKTGLGPGWSVAAVVVALAALAAGSVFLLGSQVADQADQLAADLPRAADRAREELARREWGRQVLEQMPTTRALLSGGSGLASRAARLFSTTFGVLGNVVLIVFLTIYLTADPYLYVNALLRLLPPRRRERGREVAVAAGVQLRWWLLGRLVAMAAVGVMTGLGLWALGVPQYLALGLIAAVLVAIPYVGPILAAVPALLVAFAQGPQTAAWVAGLCLAVQAVENYLVTPLVQQSMVNLPPVVAIVSVVLAGTLFGAVAMIVASPLAVVATVAVKMLYLEDVLGDRVEVKGEPAGA